MTKEDAARAYCRRGWVVLPLRRRDKMPTTPGWPGLRLAEHQLDGWGEQNVGVHLGPSGLVDVDLDTDEAAAVAPYLLPDTPLRYGRASRPEGHWLYRVEGGVPYLKLQIGRETLCELRAGLGKQSMVPPSIHPSGEVIEWARGVCVADEAGVVDAAELRRAVERVAAAALLVRDGWPPMEAAHAVLAPEAPEGWGDGGWRAKVREWCGWSGAHREATGPAREGSDVFREAVEAWHSANPADYPTTNTTCPACGAAKSWKGVPQPPGAPARWACWSAHHEEPGHRVDDHVFGDALDLAAHAAGLSVGAFLRREGFFAEDRPGTQRVPSEGGDDGDLGRLRGWVERIEQADTGDRLRVFAGLVAASDSFGELMRDAEAEVAALLVRLRAAGVPVAETRRLEMLLRGARAGAVGAVGASSSAPLLARGDEAEIAEAALMDHLGEDVVYDLEALHRYDPQLGAWVDYERHHLVQVVLRYAGRPVDAGRSRDGEQQIKRLKISNAFATGTARLIESKRRRRGWFAHRATGCGFSDGFLRSDGAWLPKGPEHRLLGSEVLGFSYRPVDHFDELPALAPAWCGFLDSVWEGDADREAKIRVLHEWLGAAMLGLATTWERALLLYGPTAGNGKSTLLRIVSSLFPAAARCSVPPHLMGESFQNVPLATARLNVVNDMPDADIMDAGHLKAIISGDEVAFNPKNRTPFSARPRAAHVMAANNLPRVRDKSRGFWRRLIVLEFARSFDGPARDPEMASRCIAEGPAIAGLAICAALAMGPEGYTLPASSERLSRVWQRAVDHVLEFAEELEVVRSEGLGTRGSVLYRAFQLWCQDAGVRPIGRNKFFEALRGQGWTQGTGSTRAWLLTATEGSEVERLLRLASAR